MDYDLKKDLEKKIGTSVDDINKKKKKVSDQKNRQVRIALTALSIVVLFIFAMSLISKNNQFHFFQFFSSDRINSEKRQDDVEAIKVIAGSVKEIISDNRDGLLFSRNETPLSFGPNAEDFVAIKNNEESETVGKTNIPGVVVLVSTKVTDREAVKNTDFSQNKTIKIPMVPVDLKVEIDLTTTIEKGELKDVGEGNFLQVFLEDPVVSLTDVYHAKKVVILK